MQEQFLDRLLTCVDCHGEFIFTAGEQLFFFDKQFKNDPKRCKPCKSRRSGLAAAANGTGPAAAGLSRTETRTTCSDCGIETTVPFKPTQGRPVLCRQCFQLKNRAAVPLVAPSDLTHGQPEINSMQPESEPAAAETVSLLTPLVTLVAAAAMVPTSMPSSVASPADLAYVASLNTPLVHPVTPSQSSAQLIAASSAELLSGKSSGAEYNVHPIEAPAA